MRNFERDASRSGKLVRELLETNRDAFYSAAIDLLRNPHDTRGSQCLITTLVGNNLLFTALSDPALPQERALAVARAAVQAHPMVDVTLAKHLADNVAAGGASTTDCQRLMEILCEISNGTRILPSLMALARQPNPYLQSKAVLMIGRANRSVKWLQNRLGDADPRVRANAVEALWGVDSEEARELLRKTARDDNNRVVGNALLGLYQLGDCPAIPQILKMAEHDSARFRATAAWIMGETGDPRFTKALARLLGEPHVTVRTRAFAALGQVRAASALAAQGGEWRVVGRFLPTSQSGWRRLQVEVGSLDGKQQIEVLPTQFVLAENGQPVVNYSVEERAAPEALSIAFLFPRPPDPESAPFTRGVLGALGSKRSFDLWSGVPYLPAGNQASSTPETGDNSEDLPLPFTCDPANVRAMVLKVPAKMECSELWRALRRAVRGEAGPARGQRHTIVYCQAETAQSPLYPEVVSAARSAHVAIHAISLVANAAIESLCQMTQGSFRTIAAEEEVTAAVEETCLNLMARYSLRYEAASPHATSLSIRVQSRAGWGEAEIPMPPPPPTI